MLSDDDWEDSPVEEMEVENKVKPKQKGKGNKKTAEVNTDNSNTADNSTSKRRKSLTVEEKYQKLDPREHVLKRPDMYIGSVDKVTQEMWVYDREKKGLVYRNITYVPGFYKIFDEILVNAADNKHNDPTMNTIRVDIDREQGRITVWNNGKGIPVVIHKEEKVYVPSLIFGLLLTGGNFDDNEKKVTGGRNGLGAKLTNIYSLEFSVETADKKEGKVFKQVWFDNMSRCNDPVINKYRGKEYTKISYVPDLKLFQMDSIDDDTLALLEKRVYDIAGVTDSSLKVYLNGERLEVKNFEAYIKMYQNEGAAETKENKVVYCNAGERWEVGVGVSDGHFQQVSFVNSICTSKGGKHVDYIAQKVGDHLLPVFKKKLKKDIKPTMVKQYLYIFVNCKIENPTFDSQSKETLTKVSKGWGSLPVLSEQFLKKVEKCGIVDAVSVFSRFKEDQMLKKQSGKKTARKLNIPKLDDANFAGTRHSQDCTLIITEGDSAKSLVVGGLSIIGRDYYGVFPLRGKMLNVRDVSRAAVIKNEEIHNLVQILGLKFDTVYEDVSSLRYGKLVIMADQDYDGSHIKGLVINFLQVFWPSLLKLNFLQQFITPIVKATKGRQSFMFFTLQQYRNWLQSHNEGKGYYIKYYKGLGTSTPQEGKEYFSNLSRHLVPFKSMTDDESSHLDMLFRKKRAEERKEWINQFHPGDYIDYAVDKMAYSDFMDKELIQFSRYDNARSIPCAVDGLKPSQRKVLFGAFKRKLTSEIKVVQFSGYVSEHAAYHHGEQSLNDTIIVMAQDFVGSNNINLFVPAGQFGSRLLGGKDAASPRYIYTYLSPITRLIFKEDDDLLCNYLVEEGQSIEPEFYLPIIPMVLVNGAEGIGTGYSTKIPNYNPVEVANYIIAKLNNEKPPELHPWWRGFTGDIYKRPNGYLIRGRITKVDDLTYVITELPIGRWTQDYKQLLTEMMLSEKKAPVIADFKENHTDTTVHFTVMLTPEQAQALQGQDLYKFFKLETAITTSNFNLFSSTGQIAHYSSPQHIIDEFFEFRLPYYQERKNFLLAKFEKEIRRLSNMTRFILEVVEGKLIINNRPRKDIMQDLVKRKYDPLYPETKKTSSTSGDVEIAKEEKVEGVDLDSADENLSKLLKGYNYLLSMKIWSLTKELVDELKRNLETAQQKMQELQNTPPSQLWKNDLEAFLSKLLELERQRMKEKAWEEKNRKRSAKNRRGGAASRRSDAGLYEELSDEDASSDDAAPRRRGKMTAKERKLTETTKRANEVTSRFSISDYYKPQVREPTAEMLKELKAMIDEETGDVVKVKRERKTRSAASTAATEAADGTEATDGKSKKPGKRGRPRKTKKEKEEEEELSMLLESYKEEEEEKELPMILESDREEEEDEELSEDEVIRENRAAIAKRRQEEKEQREKEEREREKEEKEKEEKEPQETVETVETVETKESQPALAALEPMEVEEVGNAESVGNAEPVKTPSRRRTAAKGTRRAATRKTAKETVETVETVEAGDETEKPKRRAPAKQTAATKKKVVIVSEKSEKSEKSEDSDDSDDSEEDRYVPLAERLKMRMKDDVHSSIVDELANTKSSVPAPRKRRTTRKDEMSSKRAKTSKDSDSSDSLFDF